MLEKFMEINGVVAAGEFSKEDGKLVKSYGEIESDLASLMAALCGKANSVLSESIAEYNKHSKRNWDGFKGWALSSGDFSLCVMDNFGVIAETAKADFNQIFFQLRMAASYKFEYNNM
ncbi:MAG: hypothetical protein A2W91_17810 [Bacteroidetes bacterium GWF2_38_335]|nr:MAG: hypothetical protein A2W91_17810 [Bacteroidetes bacterium GWF2_38_335]OFY78009.1 MAG: hypothetical protein A2281_18650 [Bacteroidetes bacterium RIFOXYA12_FULL_38_20]HBS88281.1 hypothetical protein [Bacteroidales bacterium]